MRAAWMVGNALALAGLIAAAYYLLITRGQVQIPPRYNPTITRVFLRVRRRRRFGAMLTALIAGMFLVAVNWFANVHTRQMLLFWILLLVLVLWLLGLALLDLLDVGKLRRQVLEQTREQVKDLLPPWPGKKHDEKNKDQR